MGSGGQVLQSVPQALPDLRRGGSTLNPALSTENGTLRFGQIFRFWSPLALTWIMMAMEGPFLAAIVARLVEPKANLAAYGVAFAIAIMIEAPIIMIMSAATALARDRTTFLKLRNFTYFLNGAITFTMAALIFTPAMDHITRAWIKLPEDVAHLVCNALIILLPWPGAIGYRRFYQGILIRSGQTRKVAYGTVVRLGAMAATGLVLYLFFELPGAYVGAGALTVGVTLEAIAARIMAWNATSELLAISDPKPGDSQANSYWGISRFYYPLALTSTVSLAVHPMVSFFMGQARFPMESLAVIPVINGLVFVFRAVGLSFQEAAIALMGDGFKHYREVRNFAFVAAPIVSLGLAVIAFTPLSWIWFVKISGLTEELAEFSLLPTRILVLIPALSILLSFQRATLVKAQRTLPVSIGTLIEVGGVLLLLYITIRPMEMVGVVAASVALLLGRIAGNAYLIRTCMGRSMHRASRS